MNPLDGKDELARLLFTHFCVVVEKVKHFSQALVIRLHPRYHYLFNALDIFSRFQNFFYFLDTRRHLFIYVIMARMTRENKVKKFCRSLKDGRALRSLATEI